MDANMCIHAHGIWRQIRQPRRIGGGGSTTVLLIYQVSYIMICWILWIGKREKLDNSLVCYHIFSGEVEEELDRFIIRTGKMCIAGCHV